MSQNYETFAVIIRNVETPMAVTHVNVVRDIFWPVMVHVKMSMNVVFLIMFARMGNVSTFLDPINAIVISGICKLLMKKDVKASKKKIVKKK